MPKMAAIPLGLESVVEHMPRVQRIPCSNPGGIWQFACWISLGIPYFKDFFNSAQNTHAVCIREESSWRVE